MPTDCASNFRNRPRCSTRWPRRRTATAARLIERHSARFGERIPLIRREHVRGYYERKPDWLVRPLGIDTVRAQAEKMEADAYRFYVEAAKRTSDAETRKLLGDLAAAEKSHETLAHRLGAEARARGCAARGSRSPSGGNSS